MARAQSDTRLADLRARLENSLEILPDKPLETAETTFAALAHLAAGNPMGIYRSQQQALPDLDEAAMERLKDLVEKRLSGIPLAHLTGRQDFMGLEFLSSAQALIPRRETEILGRSALEVVVDIAQQQAQVDVLDVCCGMGNILLSILNQEASARGFGSDISVEAVALAQRNAVHLQLEDRVTFRAGDLFNPFDEDAFLSFFDIITCNPPYISAKNVGAMPSEISEHEPRLAFDGGPFGIGILYRLIKEAVRFLKPGGWLCFEVGLGQGPPMLKRMNNQTDWANVSTVADEAGAPRCIAAQIK
ncbi:MAG: peptide chain release factor N(5)-glutamine methyltransferase [Myxococcota bacterium]|nr:peptide chain release factor N(5)-glutamine methyltransferase [Myxococcota bacterium]